MRTAVFPVPSPGTVADLDRKAGRMHVHNSAVSFLIVMIYVALALTAGRLTAAYLTRKGGTVGEFGKALAFQF